MPISLEEDEIEYLNEQALRRQEEREKIQRMFDEQKRKEREAFVRVYDR